jgi:FAD dependent oxidoreductase TIGR03364
MRTKPEIFDVAIVGAGILGIAHAYLLSRQGKRVVVLERGPAAQGASVRNFGMVWPIGQPPGELRDIALRSRALWLEFLGESKIWHRPCGSLHLAYASDELAVLEAFVRQVENLDYRLQILTPNEAMEKVPAIRAQELQGALWSPDELCVFPRQVIASAPAFLSENYDVEFRFNTAVTQIEPGHLIAAGRELRAESIYLCTGDDFETLFPESFASSGLTRCKLQMLRARPKEPLELACHLCAGLTLAHYGNYAVTPGLEALVERFWKCWPEQMRHGIHLLVSQHADGALTIGDSHRYGLNVDPFLDEMIDRLILAYLDTFLPVENLEVIERWYGVYAKHPELPYWRAEPMPGVKVLTGVGGAGMTLSFGLAERHIFG